MFRRLSASAALLSLLLMASVAHAATVPDTLSYEGRLLDSSSNPVTSAIVLRFSLWKSADWVSSDVSAGAINTGASNYGAWYETQSVTPNANGNFQVQMGSSTALPTIDFTQHKFLQVEVKSSGEADTAYVLLDPTGDDGADAVDRKTIAAVAYAKNAESVGGRTLGTSSGNVLVLGPGGRISAAQTGDGTTAQGFTINADNAAGDTTLTFGSSLTPATLKYSQQNSRFEFSDSVLIQGNLTVGSGGTISASGAIATEGGITINKDNTATDATLTFGSSIGTKTLTFSTTNQQFEFNDDVSVTGDLTVSGKINGVDITEAHFVPLRVASGGGLTISVASGSYRLGNAIINYGGTSGVSVAASATNYVFFGSGGLTVRTAVFPTDESFIPLAVVTTSSTGVISVVAKDVAQSDTRERSVLAVLTPEFDKAVYKGDGADNVGQMTMSHDAATQRNYYLWTSSRPALQDYDVFVRFLLPRDFVRWGTGADAPLTIAYRSNTANASDNALDLSLYDSGGSAVTLTGGATGLVSASWASRQLDFAGTPVWTAGQEVLLKFHLSSKNANHMDLGSIELRYTALTGQ